MSTATSCIPDHRLSVAPMMELTDRHFRFLMRLLSRRAQLYTEMLTSQAVIHGDRERLLGFDECEHPVVLQLGGSEPNELAQAARFGEAKGYDQINLNVGCPSDRVKAGRFGACLMAEPELVGRCVKAMSDAVAIPVTVKCRIGIDRNDSDEALFQFVDTVAGFGCTQFIVHARKAWLDGLSPRENRTIPPLRYESVYKLKQQYPELMIAINGGIDNWSAIAQHLKHVDGVMLGRHAYYSPAFMLDADRLVFSAANQQALVSSSADTLGECALDVERFNTLCDIARAYGAYMASQQQLGVSLSVMTRHLIALFQQIPGARAWRRQLSTDIRHITDPVELVEQALACLHPRFDHPATGTCG